MTNYAGGRVYISTGRAQFMHHNGTCHNVAFEDATEAAHWIASHTNLVFVFGDYDETAKDNVWVYGRKA